jgi:predicted AAA+ superfamily ATPase
LKEEIWNEQIIRKLEPFSYFLEVAAQMNGRVLNFSKIGRDIGVDTKTVQSYFQILEDTLLGYFLPSFHRSVRKRQLTNPKFYFFDTGVKRALERSLTVPLLPQTYAFGEAFVIVFFEACFETKKSL